MKRAMSCLLAAVLAMALAAAGAESVDFSPCLWFINGGTAPETAGRRVLVWDRRGGWSAFRQDMAPESDRAASPEEVGFVIILEKGDSSLVGFYSNGSAGLQPSVNAILHSARSGAELARETIMGGEPPQSTTSSAPNIEGKMPSDEAVAEAVAKLCANLPEEADVSLWEYVVRTDGDRYKVLDSYLGWDETDITSYVVFTPGVEITGYNGFEGGQLVIPSELGGLPVTAIGPYAFSQRSRFTEIVVPDTVTRIGKSAFTGCWDCRVVLPDALTVLPESALSSSAVQEITLPGGLRYIDDWALASNPSLQEITLPEGVLRIGRYVFMDCFSLQTITLPRSLETLYYDTFAGCEAVLRVPAGSPVLEWLENGGWEASMEESTAGSGGSDWIQKPVYEIIGE